MTVTRITAVLLTDKNEIAKRFFSYSILETFQATCENYVNAGNSLNMDCLHEEVEIKGIKSRQDTCECSKGWEITAAAQAACGEAWQADQRWAAVREIGRLVQGWNRQRDHV